MKQRLWLFLVVTSLSGHLLAQPKPAPAGPPLNTENPNYEAKGHFDFLNACGTCHGRIEQAPVLSILQKLSPERIYQTLTTGGMKSQAANLSDEQKVNIAEWISGRRLGAAENGDAKAMTNGCSEHPAVRKAPPLASWNGWSANPLANTRYQSAKAAGITPAAVARLELKWAFGLPGTSSAYGQPTIFDGRIFVGADSGYMYSLDAATGCVHWSFHAQAGLRSTPMIAPNARSNKMAAFFGDVRGNVYSLDAGSGELLLESRGRSPPARPHYRGSQSATTGASTCRWPAWKRWNRPDTTTTAAPGEAW